MKKLLSVVVLLVMLLAVSVGAESLDFFKTPVYNYTAEGQISMSVDNPEEMVNAVQSLLGIGDYLGEFETGDMFMLLSSILSYDADVKVMYDVNEDFSKIKMYMGLDCIYDVDVNTNLGVDVDLNLEAWGDLDISDMNNPKFFFVIASPLSGKYMYGDLFEFIPEDESKLMVLSVLKAFLNKKFADELYMAVVDSYEENAEITTEGSATVIKFDNAAYLKMADDMMDVLVKKIQSLIPHEQALGAEHMIVSYEDLGLQILGKDGAVIKYGENGEISSSIDLCLDFGSIYESFAGMELGFENGLVFDFTLGETQNVYDVNKTEVVLPTLTEGNSINIYNLVFPEVDYEEDYDENYVEEYPLFYASAFSTYMPDVEGEIYVPFRMLLEDAYGENINIGYDSGFITVTSEYFYDMEKLSFKVGESKANVDGFDFEVGKIILKDGVTYVSSDFFEIIFGWTLDSASYDMLYGEYYFGFFTESFEDEYYEEW